MRCNALNTSVQTLETSAVALLHGLAEGGKCLLPVHNHRLEVLLPSQQRHQWSAAAFFVGDGKGDQAATIMLAELARHLGDSQAIVRPMVAVGKEGRNGGVSEVGQGGEKVHATGNA